MRPVIDDFLPDLGQAKVFSKLDLQNGYWHRGYLKNIITPFGRYRWQCLPFGMKISSEILQKNKWVFGRII